MESNSEHSRVCLYRNSTIVSCTEARVQVSRTFRDCRARAATCGVEHAVSIIDIFISAHHSLKLTLADSAYS